MKPRGSLADLAARNLRCRQARARGLPCTEFNTPLPYEGDTSLGEGGRTLHWTYGVTTLPARRETYLPTTLESLRKAGFPSPRLFVDGCQNSQASSWEDEFGLPVTARWPKVRAYANWLLALVELYLRNPLCDRYALFQDDILVGGNLRAYLDRCPYPVFKQAGHGRPHQPHGYWSLYTNPFNQSLCPYEGRWQGWYPADQRGKGACGLVFDLATVKTLLSAPKAAAHMIDRVDPNTERNQKEPGRQYAAIDGAVLDALKAAGWLEYVHNPSLVQHVGTVSSMNHGTFPKAPTFRGEDFDHMTLIPVVRHAYTT